MLHFVYRNAHHI